jgi:hypothetical protein
VPLLQQHFERLDFPWHIHCLWFLETAREIVQHCAGGGLCSSNQSTTCAGFVYEFKMQVLVLLQLQLQARHLRLDRDG